MRLRHKICLALAAQSNCPAPDFGYNKRAK